VSIHLGVACFHGTTSTLTLTQEDKIAAYQQARGIA